MEVDDAAAAAKRRQLQRSISGISTLPEHLQHEIFSRVGDIKALFRFAVTSRGWLRCFTDRTFLRELCPSHGRHGARLLGVFVQNTPFDHYNKAMVQARMAPPPPPQRASSSFAPTFLPARGSPLGARSLVDAAAFDYAELLAARRGIVLVQIAPRTSAEKACHLLGVYNPVTGHRHVLPPLEWSLAGSSLNGYAIVTAADVPQHHPPAAAAAARFTFSQLLVITHHRDNHMLPVGRYMYVHSYSAASRSWSAPTACLNGRAFSLVGDGSAVVHRGAAHWLCVDAGLRYQLSARGGDDHHMYRLSVDVATARVSLTRLPGRLGGKQLLYVTGDGELAIASVYFMYVTLWTQAAGGGGGDTTPAWTRTSFIIPVPVPSPHIYWWYVQHELERWWNFSHGSLLALFRGSGILILDLDTKAMEEVAIPDLDNKAKIFLAGFGANKRNQTWLLPYEMDVVEFFMLQLGGVRDRLETTLSEIGSP